MSTKQKDTLCRMIFFAPLFIALGLIGIYGSHQKLSSVNLTKSAIKPMSQKEIESKCDQDQRFSSHPVRDYQICLQTKYWTVPMSEKLQIEDKCFKESHYADYDDGVFPPSEVTIAYTDCLNYNGYNSQ